MRTNMSNPVPTMYLRLF